MLCWQTNAFLSTLGSLYQNPFKMFPTRLVIQGHELVISTQKRDDGGWPGWQRSCAATQEEAALLGPARPAAAWIPANAPWVAGRTSAAVALFGTPFICQSTVSHPINILAYVYHRLHHDCLNTRWFGHQIGMINFHSWSTPSRSTQI